ncbi:hypothetical protein BJV82DRAFT_667751 [Fennellomyces sp. T-0311]|nr:hypothetical protein BJV82DRAFT_667751 [Fennellomyces sp. T-0311]
MGINFPALDDLQPDTNETWDAPVLSPSAQRDSLSLSNIAVEAMIRSGPYVPSSRNTLGSIVQEIEQNPSSLVIHLPFSELEVLQVGSETETSQGARNRMGVQLTGISDELESGLPAWSPPVINENLSKQQQGGRKKRKLNTAMPASSQNPSKRSPGKSPPNSVSSLSEQSMPSAPAHDDSPDDFASGRATIHNNDGILGDQQLELRDPQWWSTASQSNIEATILYTERQELLSSQNCEDPNHSDVNYERKTNIESDQSAGASPSAVYEHLVIRTYPPIPLKNAS